MPKRKLSELEGSGRPDNGKPRKLSMKAIRLTNKFDQGVQLISKGLKTARGFERQKLSRREKTAKSQNDSAALARLAEEVQALKGLDYQVTSERYLYKQLSKTKRIAEVRTFKEFEESKKVSTEGPKSPAESNILARLFKSTPVQSVVPKIMAEIRTLLGISDTPAGKETKTSTKKDTPSKSKSSATEDEVSGSATDDELDTQHKAVSRRADIEESDDASDDEFEGFDARLAPGSDSEDGSESDDRDEVTARKPRISASVSRSPSPAFSAESSPPPKKAKGSKGSSEPAQKTTFLPSLMMGGYWSGSESEATDDEEAAGPPKRKNRMGQQARRALWEKKFGDKANHIQKEQRNQKKNRDSGWDIRRGATGGSRGAHRGGRGGRGEYDGHGARPSNWQDGHSAQRERPKAPPKETSGPLHPSWEAKRKAKEQASTATFQGKKVVFD